MIGSQDQLITTNSKYGPMNVYIRPDNTVYAVLGNETYDRDSADDVIALRAAILDLWRPHDDYGQAEYRRLAARTDANPWYS